MTILRLVLFRFKSKVALATQQEMGMLPNVVWTFLFGNMLTATHL